MNKLVYFKIFLKVFFLENNTLVKYENQSILITEVEFMSSKELLYIEDFLGHEEYFLNHLCETKDCVDDEKLEKFICKLEKKNQELATKFYGLL